MFIKNIFTLIIIIIFISPNLYIINSNAQNITRPYVIETTVYHPNGNIFYFNGWNIRDRYTEEDISWLHDNGYNGIRLVLYWSTIERIEGNVDFILAKQILDACDKYNMWVWVDFHQWEYSPYFTFFGGYGGGFPDWLVENGGYTNDASGQQQFSDDFFLKRGYGATSWTKYVDFMKKVCELVEPYDNIFCIEPINEPMVGSTHINDARTACNARYTEIITIIREIIPNVIVMLHHIDNGYDQKQNFPNIIWTQSAYREYGAGTTESGIQSFLDKRYEAFVIDMGVPYFISETGVIPSVSREDAEFFITTLLTKYKETFSDSGIGWNFWLYDKAPSSGGYVCPRTSDGSASWLQPIIAKNMNTETKTTEEQQPSKPIINIKNDTIIMEKPSTKLIISTPEIKNSFSESAKTIIDVLPIMSIFVGVGLFKSRKFDSEIIVGYAIMSVVIVVVSSMFL